mmetsp:Transcript_7616/g.11897  ORF Transcript_7616/g.11897 Transcript_7616/m.11897 type:complete len:334 (+) Transcript_7616:183-1184(+)
MKQTSMRLFKTLKLVALLLASLAISCLAFRGDLLGRGARPHCGRYHSSASDPAAVRALLANDDQRGPLVRHTNDLLRNFFYGPPVSSPRGKHVWDVFDQMEREMEIAMQSFFPRLAVATTTTLPQSHDEWRPSFADAASLMPLDFFEGDNMYAVEAHLPGVKQGDLKIEVNGNRLTITAVVRDRKENGFQQNMLQRTITVAPDADIDSITASYQNGVLRVTANKKQGAAAKPITISFRSQDAPTEEVSVLNNNNYDDSTKQQADVAAVEKNVAVSENSKSQADEEKNHPDNKKEDVKEINSQKKDDIFSHGDDFRIEEILDDDDEAEKNNILV